MLEGLIGIGKTTLGRSLKNFLEKEGFKVKFFEEIINPSLLNLYLSDMKKYAFSFQSIQIIERMNIHRQASQFAETGGIAIIDRGIYGDMAFAQMQHQKGFFTDEEWQTYRSIITGSDLIDPHCIIHLRCHPDTSINRTSKRGISSETTAYDYTYMSELDNAHVRSISDFSGPVYSLDWNDDSKVENGILGSTECISVLTGLISCVRTHCQS